MCDYSLHLVASRPAKIGDKLVATDFARSITRGFSAVGEPEVAVCLLPGTEIAFDEEVQYDRAFSLFGKARTEHKVARFRQVNMDDPHVHHDALEFPGGQIVMVTRLIWASAPRCCSCRRPLESNGSPRKARRRASGRSNRLRNSSARPAVKGAPVWLSFEVGIGCGALLTAGYGNACATRRRLSFYSARLPWTNEDCGVSVVPRPRHAGHTGLLHHPNVRFDAAQNGEEVIIEKGPPGLSRLATPR